MTEPSAAELRSRRVAASLARQEDIDGADFRALRQHLLGYVHSRFPATSSEAAGEAVDEAIARFVAAVQVRARVAPATALAYLRRIVRNLVIDWHRSDARERSMNEVDPGHGDDAIARLIEKTATAALIEELLGSAAGRGDTMTTRVINAYLNLIEQHGGLPSTRQVALEADVSHTTVSNVLARLKKELRSRSFPD